MALSDIVLYGLVVVGLLLLLFCFFGCARLNPFDCLTSCGWLRNCLDCARICGISRSPTEVVEAKVVKKSKAKKAVEDDMRDEETPASDRERRLRLLELAILQDRLRPQRYERPSRSELQRLREASERGRLLEEEKGEPEPEPEPELRPAPATPSYDQRSIL